eukprot:CCRYP_015154-RA/>CCRYP_015154-RA protein AED:0.47 eAED:0.47 QI:0/-1/0/1/-1/0/1/0/97
MVTTGTKHAIQCGAFTDAWKEWNRIPRANQTWLAWKTHWTRAFEEQKTIQRLTGGKFSPILQSKPPTTSLRRKWSLHSTILHLPQFRRTRPLKNSSK